MQIHKTVFISYRRTNSFTARAVFQNLTTHGYDVFLDTETLDSGAFDQSILRQIAARAHFVLVLTPSALERCVNEGDWLRREIEEAMRLKRNIVPLMFEDFDFRAADKYLVGEWLPLLKSYNGLRFPSDFFDEAMERLRTRFLNVPLELVLHPVAPVRQPAPPAQSPAVTAEQLSGEEYFERAKQHADAGNTEFALGDVTEALRRAPTFADAYVFRGALRYETGDIEGAAADYTAALRLTPGDAGLINARAGARLKQNDLAGALADYEASLMIDPDQRLGNVSLRDFVSLLRQQVGGK
ncbi:MAG: TIR domain-containing protein [Blastochloris sp.]|nr:TIR domain-containing protein [Blastochloris sp.]